MTPNRKEMLTTLSKECGYGVSLLQAKGFYRLRIPGYGGEKEIKEIKEKFKNDAKKYNLEIIDYLQIDDC